MAQQTVIHEDDSWISKLDGKLHRLETGLVILSGMAIVGLVLLAVLSVSGRWFFNQPLAGYIDWIQQFMPIIAFAGIAYGLRNGSHIRMDMVIGKWQGRGLYAAEWLSTLFILLLMLLLLWGSYAHFARSFDVAQPLFSRDSSMDIGLPLWPAKLLVPFAFFIMALRAILQLIAYGKAFYFNQSKPVAVPLMKSQSIKNQNITDG